MVHNRRADRLAEPVHELNDLGREAGLEKNFHEHVSGVRHILSRFEHARVPAHERGKHFPRGDRHRKIERRDDPRHADGPAETHRPFVAQFARHRMSEQPAPFAPGIVRRVDSLLHVAACLGERLAHLARHQLGDLVLPRGEQIARATEHIAPRGRGCGAPDLEPPARRFDGALDVVRVGQREVSDDVGPIRRILILEILPAGRRHPGAADEILERLHGRMIEVYGHAHEAGCRTSGLP